MRAAYLSLVAFATVTLAQEFELHTVEDLPFDINIGEVEPRLNDHCGSQTGICRQLCNEATLNNVCNAFPELVWSCVCRSNASEPALEFYTGTIVTHLCEEAFAQCTNTNAGNVTALEDICEGEIRAQCGTTNPADAVTDEDEDEDDEAASSATTQGPTASGGSGAEETATTTTSSEDLSPTQAALGSGAMLVALGMVAGLI